MAYRIEFVESSKAHLKSLTARQRRKVIEAIEKQLTHEPLNETRNRKPLRPNPIAPWELRVGKLRIFYDVPADGYMSLPLEKSAVTSSLLEGRRSGYENH